MAHYICRECGYEGLQRVVRQGSRKMEIMLWVVFLFPAPFYSAWRWYTRRFFCPHCGAQSSMVKLHSDEGMVIQDEMEKSLDAPSDKYSH